MALASNQRHQMAKRLQADIAKLNPDLTVTPADLSGDPELIVKESSTVLARILIKRRSFSGFNVVAELSSSAAEGLPEHECWLAVDDSTSIARIAKLTKACTAIGASSLKLCVTSSAPAEGDFVDSAVTAEIPNDSRLGATGA